jgi:hypothetical protein
VGRAEVKMAVKRVVVVKSEPPKHLRRKAVRFPPDKVNLRTGECGVVDEELGRDAVVVAVRTAVQ